MKKHYLFYLIVALFSFGYSQSTIVTVDRNNITGVTATGNDPAISSSGLVRGSGIALSNINATNHTSNGWDAPTQAQAVINNDYLEWSVTASADNTIELTEFDLRLRGHADGPANWQIFYSLDNFTTAGIALTNVEATSNTASNFNLGGLSIFSGTAGTITFRLYAWNATNANRWLQISRRAAWSAYGITRPGIRLIGNVITTATNSTSSDIISTSFNPADNIDYKSYTAVSGLTTSNAIKIGEFTIRDGGSSAPDADAFGTILTELEINVANGDNVSTLAIFDGSINLSEALVISEKATISGISGLSAGDDGIKTFSIYGTYKTNVTDNAQIQLTIAGAFADTTLGSSFDAYNAGGAQTPTTGDDNRIEVIATKMVFGQQPVDVNQFEIMEPFPTILAVDSNDNQDLDYNNSVTIIASDGDLDPSTIIYPITNGIATLNTLVFTKREVVAFLVALGNSLSSTTSTAFNVNGPLINIAIQDFDGFTPEWSYTTDVTTFTNGWGTPTGGYFDVIDSALATPLDNDSFTGNIFGVNDLNDEGNGTSGFAYITFATQDISAFDNVRLTFDWDIEGYDNNTDDAQYRLVYDGTNQPYVFLLNGNDGVPSKEGTVSIDIPNSVNTVSLIVRVRNNGENGFAGFDNFRLSSVFDGLIHIDDGTFVGWEPSAPNSTTGSQNAYVYSGSYNVGTNVQINDFFIRNGATTTISAGQSLKSNAGVRNNGTLELNSVSTTYSSLITDRMYGEVIYNRHVNQFSGTGSTTGNNDLVSAPVTNANQTFLALRTENTTIPSGNIGGVPSFLFGPFNNVTDEIINYTAADNNSIIAPGIGYRTASTTPGGSTFKFVGDVETGTLAVPITVGAGNIFNLIGNPYPSYIKLSTFLAANNSQFRPSKSGVYGYVGNMTNGYAIWNQAYSDANPSALIAPGQGFFVSSKTGGGTVNFTPAMRTIGTADDFIAGRSTNLNLAHLNLKATNTTQSYETSLYFNDNASLSMDPGYDSEMFEATTPNFAIYSHLVEDNSGKDMAVQSVSYSDIENVIIPIGINVAQGEQTVVSISEFNLPEDINVILEDNVNNTFTNLLDSDYTFTSGTTLTDTGRFYLHVSQQASLGVNDNTLKGLEILSANKQIIVKGQLDGQTNLTLYDIQARIVKTQILNSKDTEHHIDVSKLSAGIYVVQLSNSSDTRTQKVIIK